MFSIHDATERSRRNVAARGFAGIVLDTVRRHGGRGGWNLRLKVCGGSVKFRRLPAQCIQRRSWPVHVDAIPGRSSVGLCCVVCFRGQTREGDAPAVLEEREEEVGEREKLQQRKRKKEQENAEMVGVGLRG